MPHAVMMLAGPNVRHCAIEASKAKATEAAETLATATAAARGMKPYFFWDHTYHPAEGRFARADGLVLAIAPVGALPAPVAA